MLHGGRTYPEVGGPAILLHFEVTIFQSDSLPHFVPPRASMPAPGAAAQAASWAESRIVEAELCGRHCCFGPLPGARARAPDTLRARAAIRLHRPGSACWLGTRSRDWQGKAAKQQSMGKPSLLRLLSGMQLRCPGLAARRRGKCESRSSGAVILRC